MASAICRHRWACRRAVSYLASRRNTALSCEAPRCIASQGFASHNRFCSGDAKRSKFEETRLLKITNVVSGYSKFSLATFGIGVVVMTVGGYLLYHGSERKAPIAARKHEPVGIASAHHKSTIGGPFKLINHKGEVVTDRDFVGKWTLLYFGFTSCPDNCPEELQKIAELVNKIEKKKKQEVVPVFITLDPERDSVAQLAAYISEFHPKMVGLTGSVDEIRRVAREYRVFFRKVEDEGTDYLIDHSNFIYLLDPNGNFVKVFGREYDADSLFTEISNEMEKISSASHT